MRYTSHTQHARHYQGTALDRQNVEERDKCPACSGEGSRCPHCGAPSSECRCCEASGNHVGCDACDATGLCAAARATLRIQQVAEATVARRAP